MKRKEMCDQEAENSNKGASLASCVTRSENFLVLSASTT